MLTAIISFLGGSAFRMIFGEVSAWLTKKQDHAQEMELRRLQGELDAAQHARNLEAIRVQAELGVKTIQVQAEADVDRTTAEAWLEAVKATAKQTGVKWVDAWNAVIRPAGATWSILMLSLHEAGLLAQPLSEGTQSVCYAFIGIFVADRALGKKGK